MHCIADRALRRKRYLLRIDRKRFSGRNACMKRIVETDRAPKAIGPYSQAVETNGTLYISGQIPVNPATGALVEGGIREQAEQVLENIGAILRAAGCDYGAVVKTTCLLSDMANFSAMNEVYARYFTGQPPARATYAVAGLPLGALVEIEAVAVRGKFSPV